MKYFLIRFTYDHYCQGYEDAQETLLVKAPSFEAACNRVKIQELGVMQKYHAARDFENLTLALDE
jgi:hypothetical protein